jgi:hypothetical protein
MHKVCMLGSFTLEIHSCVYSFIKVSHNYRIKLKVFAECYSGVVCAVALYLAGRRFESLL